jgi:tryptophan synthase alpha subunit
MHLGLLLILAFASGATVEAAAQDPIRVCLRTGTAGGVVAPGAEDSLKDLAKALRGRDVITLVADEKTADVILQVESRNREFRGAPSPYISRNPHTGQSTTVSHAQQSCVVYVKLVAGHYERLVEGTGESWSKAAKDVASQAEGWIKLNQQQLRDLRRAPKP